VFEDDLKFKFTIYLVCLLLFVAAVDTIPDPPAVNPPGGHSFQISAQHVCGAFTPLENEWLATPCSQQRESNFRFSVWPVFGTKPVAAFPSPLVHHATDPSPPAIS
jgi:hypothetical protein